MAAVHSDGGPRGRDGHADSSRRRPARSMRDVIQAARDEISEVLGRPAESVSAAERTDDGWLVTVEVVELERVPPTTSVLASYEVQFDASGEVEGFNRLRRYYRNQAGEL